MFQLNYSIFLQYKSPFPYKFNKFPVSFYSIAQRE